MTIDTVESKGRVAYICLQATRQGQASFAHVREILSGLVRLGWACDLFEPAYAGEPTPAKLRTRMLEFGRVQRRVVQAMPGYDVLYVRDHPAVLPAMRAAHRRGIPIVLEVNGIYDELKLAYPWTSALMPLLRWNFLARLRLAGGVIVVTEQMREVLRGFDGSKEITVVPNGADPVRFTPEAAAERIHPSRYVAFVGVLAVWQGIDTILEALRDPAWPDDVDVVIAGSGLEQAKIEAAQVTDSRIVYLGQVPYASVPAILAGSMASLSPKSDLVGLSGGVSAVKLYESMACGVPVVVSSLPGQGEVVEAHRCGLVVPPSDPRALAEAVARLAADPEEARAMGDRGRRAVVEQHSWAVRAVDTGGVLTRVLGRAEDEEPR
jgi:glycosyltransferase involved in cell wall biosynthesis